MELVRRFCDLAKSLKFISMRFLPGCDDVADIDPPNSDISSLLLCDDRHKSSSSPSTMPLACALGLIADRLNNLCDYDSVVLGVGGFRTFGFSSELWCAGYSETVFFSCDGKTSSMLIGEGYGRSTVVSTTSYSSSSCSVSHVSCL